jgi:hypothetical protein
VVTIRKRQIGTRQYFYLQHTLRTPKGIETRERYLGARLPSGINEIKRDFLIEIYNDAAECA